MKAESEVAISCAISIFSNEKFKADDDRLNYQSYKELGLICGQCRELIFFKKGTERVSHFSHFKTTGKDCQWRTGSDSNTLHTDAEGREQSLEKFQTKFKSIIEEGIIKHQQISSSQLREQIKEGQRLVSTYKIDIDSWLRWFNQNRKPLRNLAKSLYQTNELVSQENQIILLNFVDYLCVPASEYILRDILYYVFGLLDKEISLKKYLEELPSKVIELMSYAEWEKEYKRAKESVNFSSYLKGKSNTETEVAATKPTEKLANECLGETENSSTFNTVFLEEVANPIGSDSIATEEDVASNSNSKDTLIQKLSNLRVESEKVLEDSQTSSNAALSHSSREKVVEENTTSTTIPANLIVETQTPITSPESSKSFEKVIVDSDLSHRYSSAKERILLVEKEVTKVINLSDVKTVAKNSFEWRGLLGTVPSIIKLVPSGDAWIILALPIPTPKTPLYILLADQAIKNHWDGDRCQIRIRTPIYFEVNRLQNNSADEESTEKLEDLHKKIVLLDRISDDVLHKRPIPENAVMDSSQKLQRCLQQAEFKTLATDPYYSKYYLGSVKFMVEVETEEYPYLLDDFMSKKRIASPVLLALNWLKLVPPNLKQHFGTKKPTVKEINSYLQSKFDFRNVDLEIYEKNGQIFLEILYLGESHVKQLLTIKSPEKGYKARKNVPVKVASTISFAEKVAFKNFLQSSDSLLRTEVQGQLTELVEKFLSANYQILVGHKKVAQAKKPTEIVGYDRQKIINFLRPFTLESGVKNGQLIWLRTGKIISEVDIGTLLSEINKNWKYWDKKDKLFISIGGFDIHNQNPGVLVLKVCKLLRKQPHLDKLVWKDLIEVFYQLTSLAIGFRTSKGVILTPDSLYSSNVEQWMQRIKIQLIAVLLSTSKTGSVEAWLQKDISSLYDALEKAYPNWKFKVSKDVLKHLEELHNALDICLQVEEPKFE
ncbi:hypothetical protein QUA00_00710 [Microcoleus sp. T2B6]|uniref:hypothetical protein n=1 Tax=Microcoleus sp. T2B6 TaxID=3055424 RepID=UPI002FD6C2F4